MQTQQQLRREHHPRHDHLKSLLKQRQMMSRRQKANAEGCEDKQNAHSPKEAIKRLHKNLESKNRPRTSIVQTGWCA